MDWIKAGKTADRNGTTVIYQLAGTGITVESRRRHIPHANGSGTWDHTSYFVVRGGKDVVERWSLKDAKAYAEMLYEDERRMACRRSGLL